MQDVKKNRNWPKKINGRNSVFNLKTEKKKDEKEDKNGKKKKDDDKKKPDSDSMDHAKHGLDEEQDDAEAGEEILADAEETATVAIAEAVGSDDPAESLRAVASEWLGSVLQHSHDK